MRIKHGVFEVHQGTFLPKYLENHINLPVFDPPDSPADHATPRIYVANTKLQCSITDNTKWTKHDIVSLALKPKNQTCATEFEASFFLINILVSYPTPIRYLGFSLGSISVHKVTIFQKWSFSSPPLKPPTAKPGTSLLIISKNV